MDIKTKEIECALSNMDVSSARGRQMAKGRAIDLDPKQSGIRNCAQVRAERYVDIAAEVKSTVANNNIGISNDELDSIEFIIEQLEDAAKKAFNTVINHY